LVVVGRDTYGTHILRCQEMKSLYLLSAGSGHLGRGWRGHREVQRQSGFRGLRRAPAARTP